MVSPMIARVRAAWLQISADSCAVKPADLHAAVSESCQSNCLMSGFLNSAVPSSSTHLFIFRNMLSGDLSQEEKGVVDGIQSYYEEAEYRRGDSIFQKNTQPDAFYIVVRGAVAVLRDKKGSLPSMIMSGAGTVESQQSLSSTNLVGMIGESGQHESVESFYKAGGV